MTAKPVDTTFARTLTASNARSIFDEEFAAYLDRADALAPFRHQFSIPSKKAVGSTDADSADDPCVYLAGNSLGLMPLRAPGLINQELAVWANKGVLGHFDHPHNRPWVQIDEVVIKPLAALVGAKQSEVACMSTLTANLHALLAAFYKPTKTRFKILFEQKAFPSDIYAFTSQALHHGLDPNDVLLALAPRQGEHILRTEDILQVIKEQGDSIAVVFFSGVHFYSGQCFEMETITKAGQAQGCLVGWDLAHAIGNVTIKLHDWNVDFAAWCTYKYLNSGPGSIAGLFVHERHADPSSLSRLSGWWGHNLKTRFDMPFEFDPIWGAAGFQMSNPYVLAVIALHASLQVFQEAMSRDGFGRLRSKSELLTAYLEKLLTASDQFVKVEDAAAYQGPPAYTIITPTSLHQRGAQLSLLFLPAESQVMEAVAQSLSEAGVVADERKPDVIRFAPTPLYNTFEDAREAALAVSKAIAECRKTRAAQPQ